MVMFGIWGMLSRLHVFFLVLRFGSLKAVG
jgi:hypothetical protein